MRRFLLLLAFGLLTSTAVRAEFVIVAGAASSFGELSRDLAEQLFLGRRSTTADGHAVQLLDLPHGAERDRFYFLLTAKKPAQVRAWWSRQVFSGRALPPFEAASIADLRRRLGDNPDAIGYLPVDAASTELRILLRLP